MTDLNRLERIIIDDHRSEDDNIMLLDFQLASVRSLECTDYKKLDSLKRDLMSAYHLDEIQYARYVKTATEYNFYNADNVNARCD